MRVLNLSRVRHAVVVAPHSDDETIGAFHLIRKLRVRGARVDIIVITDGSASHRNSVQFPKRRLVAERQAETVRAMQFAGVPRKRIQFLGLPDGGLDTYDPLDLRAALVRLARRPTPDLLIEPTFDDDHPDHRQVARMCARAWSPKIPRIRYMVWPAKEHRADMCSMPTIAGSALAKKIALGRYRTQTGLIRDDPQGFALSDAMVRRMCTSRERFQWG
ncbi:PIG-L family deacetylase [uncultured Sulfitobacter sp.]|uniref:PIG-L deacetylase family protein n=1 Tax=uncultured Sulfitobacter sp. TaxID=191468 RepID=UPI00344EA198